MVCCCVAFFKLFRIIKKNPGCFIVCFFLFFVMQQRMGLRAEAQAPKLHSLESFVLAGRRRNEAAQTGGRGGHVTRWWRWQSLSIDTLILHQQPARWHHLQSAARVSLVFPVTWCIRHASQYSLLLLFYFFLVFFLNCATCLIAGPSSPSYL